MTEQTEGRAWQTMAAENAARWAADEDRAFTRQTKPEFTNRRFVRSHLVNPRGRGTWAFQATRSDMAFDSDLFGEVVFAPMLMSLGEAKAWMRTQGRTGMWAVMP